MTSWMIRLGLLVAGFSSGCSMFEQGACENLAKEVCETCDVSDSVEDTMCACLEEGEVDNADRYFADQDSAEQWCFRLQQEVKATYNTDETVKECKQDLDFIKEYEDDACVYLGYESASSSSSSDWDTAN